MLSPRLFVMFRYPFGKKVQSDVLPVVGSEKQGGVADRVLGVLTAFVWLWSWRLLIRCRSYGVPCGTCITDALTDDESQVWAI